VVTLWGLDRQGKRWSVGLVLLDALKLQRLVCNGGLLDGSAFRAPMAIRACRNASAAAMIATTAAAPVVIAEVTAQMSTAAEE
jgi:hypothetical protein